MPSPELRGIPCVIMRAGTSRGIFLRRDDLPSDVEARNRVIASVFGSPHPQQIDGIGGAAVVTSKLAIVGSPTRPDADIDFNFVQVGINELSFDATGTCGNVSSAVGPYAVDEGYVSLVSPVTTVRIHDTNTGRIMRSEVPIFDGYAGVNGDATIAGVNGTGAPVILDYADLVGAITGKLLPSGSPVDLAQADDGTTTRLSMIDASVPIAHVVADELGLTGAELPHELDHVADTLESLRTFASKAMGIDTLYGSESRLPFVCVVSRPQTYTAVDGRTVNASDVDLVVRLRAVNRVHEALAATAAVNIAAAAATEGTVVHELCAWNGDTRRTIRLGHPSGVMNVEVATSADGQFERLAYVRTVRRVMDGSVYVPASL